MKKNKVLSFAAVYTCLFAPSVLSLEVETVEVYGNFRPPLVERLPVVSFVLDRKQIQSISGTTALDILSQVPGLNVRNSGAAQEIFLRGAETNFVLIQIDGVQVNNPLDTRGGGFDLASISKELVERVEIIKGAQSLSHGSDAIAGVINFITRTSKSSVARVSLGIQPDGQKTASFKAGTKAFGVSASVLDTDRQPNGDKQRATELILHSDFDTYERSQTRFNLRFSDYSQSAFPDQSGGVELASSNEKDVKEGRLLSASARHNHTLSDAIQTAAQLEYYRAEDSLASPGIAPFFSAPPSFSENTYQFYKLKWLNSFEYGQSNFVLGADYKSESGDNSGYLEFFGSQQPTDFEIDRSNRAVFLDAKYSKPRFSISSGLRHDSTSGYGSQNTWKLGADVMLGSMLRVYSNIGTAFKLPSLYALGNNLIGNTELRPEEAQNIDLGLEWQHRNHSLMLSLFQYDYKNLIDFDAETFRLVNRADISSQGAELVFLLRPSDRLSVQSSLTYVDLDADTGEALAGRPTWLAGALVDFRWNDQWRSALRTNYVGNTTATSLHTGDFSVADLDAYTKFDVFTEYLLSDSHSFELNVTNAFNEDYRIAVGVPGPEFGIGLKYTLILKQ